MGKTYLLIPHIRIQNANAMSTPYTLGFPAMTAWLGAMHALERKIQQQNQPNITFTGLAVSSHQCQVQRYRGPGDYYYSIIGTANPLKKSKKTGGFERPPFIEEARCRLEVTLLLETKGIDPDQEETFLKTVRDALFHLKMAGGDIVSDLELIKLKLVYYDGEDEQTYRQIINSLMPGYVLVERRNLMDSEEDQDSLEALLRGLVVRQIPQKDENGKVSRWQAQKVLPSGWLVPIAVGFKDLSGPLKVDNQRDKRYEHHFVEPVVTLGEFIMPYRLFSLEEMIWRYQYDKDQGLYLCVNKAEGEA